jgi:hypothetical protein
MSNGPIIRGIKGTRRLLFVSLVRPLRPPPIPLHEIVDEIGIGGRTTVLVGLATLINYLAWLGWDQTRDFPPNDGSGAYEPWQYVGLVLGLAVIAAAAGWRRCPWQAVITATTVMMLCVIYDGGTDQNADGLYIVDAFVAATHTFTTVGLVALVADEVSGGKHPGQAPSRWRRRSWVWVVLVVMLMLSILFWI